MIRILTSAIRWFARVEGTFVALMFFLFVFGEGFGDRGTYTLNPFVLSAADLFSMSLLTAACIGLFLAWRWERPGGAITVLCMVAFLFCRWGVWGPGFPMWAILAVLIPGTLYLLASFTAYRIFR